MNGTILNSLSYTYCSADDSVCPTPQRRGLMDDRYKNTTCEFTIQQKRFMESKLEAARNDREEMYENFKVIRLEFSKYKDHAIKKQSGLESENAKLKEELEICRTRLIVSENEKQGLLKSIDCLQQTIKDQNENFQKSNILFEKRLERVEAREKRLRDSTLDWCKNIDQRNTQMITKFEELIAQMVKNAFQNYSHKVFENCKHERHDFSKGMRNVANNDPEYQEVLDIMANGIHLPPCRKKPPRNFQPFSDHPLDHDLPKTHSLPAKPQNSNKSKREKNKKVDKSLNNPIPTENRGNLII